MLKEEEIITLRTEIENEEYSFKVSKKLNIEQLKIILLFLSENELENKDIGLINYEKAFSKMEKKQILGTVHDYDVCNSETRCFPMTDNITKFFSNNDLCSIKRDVIASVYNTIFNFIICESESYYEREGFSKVKDYLEK